MNKKFDRQSSFGWLINVVASQASKKFDTELKKHGLTIALWPPLMCLWEEEGINQSEIAKKSKVENSTTTRTLDKLAALGLIERRDDPHSRRSFLIYLTDKGRDLKEVLLPIPAALNQEMISTLDEDEQKQIIRLLQKLVAKV